MKKIIFTGLFVVLFSFSFQHADAATMSDYCITPPYIGSTINPNLLLMIDNSASMNDLNYIDKGTATRPAMYCYDDTYQSANTYVGYFKTGVYYSYDFTNNNFAETASLPSSCPNASDTLNKIPNTLLVCYSTSRTLTRFAATGQYLNWLTMSKFDIQKQILTGGKYDTASQDLIAESRGCVGHIFIKQPLTADYVEGGTNTPLGVTFGISGPVDQYNPSAPSPGGLTHIDVFIGAYNSEACQTAINDFADPLVQKQTLQDDIGTCIGYSATNRNTCQYPNLGGTYTQCSIDADCGYIAGTCGPFTPNGTCGPLTGGICSTSTLGTCTHNDGTCPASGSANGKCVGGNRAGNACTTDKDCTGNGTCTRYCSGGRNAGLVCGTNTGSNSAVCAFSSCTAGDTSKSSCTIDSDCNLKTCSNAGPKNGQPCTANSNCNSGKCTAGKPATTDCLQNSDCNLAMGLCIAGNIGHACSASSDCTIVGQGQCLPPASVQLKSTYGQSMHTCYQLLFKGQGVPGPDDLNLVSGNNACNSFYPTYKTCKGGSKDGSMCTGALDCPGTCQGGANNGQTCTSVAACPGGACNIGACINGPNAIRPGSPILICGSDYAGACAATSDNWATSGGVSWPGNVLLPGDACVSAAIMAYCLATEVPNVIDPTENASVTGLFANLPAVLSDVGVQGQLGDPIAQLPVSVKRTDIPTGIIQQFDSSIRMGAMTFDIYGTPSECTTGYPPPANAVACPQVCSTDPSILCGSKMDCPFPGVATCTPVSGYTGARTCYYAGSGQQVSPITSCNADTDCGLGQSCVPGNSDGAKIIYYIGYGTCYDKTTDPMTQVAGPVRCTIDANCPDPAKQICKSDGAGSHDSGLINTVDSIKGATWTPFAEGFYNAIGYFGQMPDKKSNTALRINTADFNEDFNPSQLVCQKNNVLLITDGMSTADLNTNVNTFAGLYTSGTPTLNGPGTGTGSGCTVPYQGSINLDNLAWAAKNRNIAALVPNTAVTAVPSTSNQSISTYAVLNGTSNGLSGECNSQTLLSDTALNGGTSLYTAETPTQLSNAIKSAFDSIAAKAASGTAASVLASSEGSGANLIQAVFYPQRKFWDSTLGTSGANKEISWISRLTNLWYYVDPHALSSTIMEDNGCPLCSAPSTDAPNAPYVPNTTPWNGDKVLDLNVLSDVTPGDFIVQMYYDKTAGATMARRWTDPAANGIIGTPLPTINFEDLGYLWEAGTLLWRRDISTAAGKRKIYTTIDAKNFLTGNFSNNTINPAPATGTPDANNSTILAPYLQAANVAEASDLISWVSGYDKVCSFTKTQSCNMDSDCPGGETCRDLGYRSRSAKIESIDSIERVWKLGDVINSTPRIVSWKEPNYYYTRYGDGTYYMDTSPNSAPDSNHFTTTAEYKKRGMVFAGGNDGMLHAFKLGTMQLNWGQGPTLKARLLDPDYPFSPGTKCNSSITNPTCGQEKWAFIPKNALPYLKYMTDKSYCHLYSVDLTPYIFDASINGAPGDLKTVDSWRTVLIGGMRFGGACKMPGTCGGGNCVDTPALDPMHSDQGLGYSSYFAIDITDPNNPILLWEFADKDLGFSTTGPAIVRTGDKTKNGNWFVVFASGPTGPIDTNEHQFLGKSNQSLKLFVLNLKDGTRARPDIDTQIPNAFGGSLSGGALDLDDQDYQDELVYVPYVRQSTKDGTWTDGGIVRLMTLRNSDANTWKWNTLIDGAGPITASVGKVFDKTTGLLWLLFGSGRYYYLQSSASDDPKGQRYLFGIKDPCVVAIGSDTECTLDDPANLFGKLTDVTCKDLTGDALTACLPTENQANSDKFFGWKIALDADGYYTYPPDPVANFQAERLITDPLVITSGSGLAYFTTYKPYTDLCLLSGNSFLWVLQYNTGGPPLGLRGLALVQTSTGAIQQINLSNALGEQGGRKGLIGLGQPPIDQGLTVQAPAAPVRRTIHVRER